jgi:hypothetical protein
MVQRLGPAFLDITYFMFSMILCKSQTAYELLCIDGGNSITRKEKPAK